MWRSLAEIDSVSLEDMDEYHSRPDDRVRQFVGKQSGDIVIYGARGKFSRHVSLMLLRAIQETRAKVGKVHLVSSPREDREFDKSVKPFADFVQQHHIDLINATESNLLGIPKDARWVLYFAGYKFARPGDADRDYALKCDLYGMVIPSLVFSYHQQGADIVVMGSYNGLRKTAVDRPADESAPLMPLPANHYGRSILDKERVIHAILEGRGLENPSRAVILRGGYYTDACTYGGFEPEIRRIMAAEEIDLSEKAYFNLLSHRNTAIATILSKKLVGEPVSTYNLAGWLVDIREAGKLIADELRKYPDYANAGAKFTGKPAETHLLANGSALEAKLGKPNDSLRDIIHAQVYWMINGGYTRGVDHKIGKNL